MDKIFYRGRSMRGTFVDGDYLQVLKIKLENLKSGDVVVFKKPFQGEQKKELIVHRVDSIQGDTIFTRGDYNIFQDKDILDAHLLIGRVISCERKGKKIRVANGFFGFLRSKKIRLELLTKKRLFPLVNPLYSLIKKTRLVPRFWKPNIKMITLNSKKGQKIKYTHNGKTVLVRDGDNIIFKRRPYDLLF